MGKLFKVLFGFIGVLLSLFLITAISLWLFVSTDFIKSTITDWVKNNTDRELSIDGSMHWTFFPHIGLAAKDVHISNPKGFGSENFASADTMKLSLQIKPLLKKNFSINQLSFNNLVLNLRKNNSGKGNWKFTKTQTDKKTAAKQSANNASIESGNDNEKSFQLHLNKLSFKNSQINFYDQKTGKRTKIEHLNLKSSNFQPNEAFKISANFLLDGATKIKLLGKTQYHQEQNRLDVNDFQFSSKPLNKSANSVSIDTTGSVDFKNATLDFKPLKIQYGSNIKASGKLHGSNILNNPKLTGQLSAPRLRSKQLLGNIHLANVNTQFNYRNDIIKLSPFTANVFNGRTSGTIVINQQGKTNSITLQQALSNINLAQMMQQLTGSSKITGAANIKTNISFATGPGNTVKEKPKRNGEH